ncbi:MAG: CHASE2 domain-containing protein [Salinibacter sp.]
MAAGEESTYRSTLVLAGIAGTVAVLVCLLTLTPPFQTLEHKASDLLFRIRGPQDLSDSPVVLVTIDQSSYKEIPYKDYPWPRGIYARLIENLNQAGARAIGLDIMFDASRNPRGDSLFAEALAKYENVVLAGRVSRQDVRRGATDQSQEINKVEPIPLFKAHNPNPFGVVTNTLDYDDVLRRYLLYQNYLDERYYALGLELLRLYEGFPRSEAAVHTSHLEWGSRHIPLVQSQSMRINYYGPAGSFPTFSFAKVIDDSTFQTNFERNAFPVNTFNNPDTGLLQRGVFEDKIVLVGVTLPEEHDFHTTPFAGAVETGAMSGVEVHAHALQTLLDQNYLYSMPRSWAWGLILVVALLMTVAARRLNIWLGLGLLLLFWGGYFAASIWLFVAYNYMIAITGPVTAALLGYGGTLGYGYVVEQRQKQRIKGMFRSYVSPALVDRMVERGEEPKLGGEQQHITAFFSDIQGFSTISEQLDAPRLVELMNEYLSAMTNIVTEQGGTLDKYIGDAIMAFYGAPVYFEDHAYRACVTSQLMQRELDTLRERWKTDGRDWPDLVHHLRNRIGINTGTVVTGNIGSQRRFNYTMMGDHVNLAARCESGAKSYGVFTMVTAHTKEEAEQHGDRCIFRALDQIVVKGKTEPVQVYEIYGLEEDVDSKDRECIELYEEGYRLYLQQDWAGARRHLEDAALLEPHQPDEDPGVKTNPSLVLLERCRHLKEDPPSEDWNGVYVMETK